VGEVEVGEILTPVQGNHFTQATGPDQVVDSPEEWGVAQLVRDLEKPPGISGRLDQADTISWSGGYWLFEQNVVAMAEQTLGTR
jgi:hypothetical protein